jgi:hypothetical protein
MLTIMAASPPGADTKKDGSDGGFRAPIPIFIGEAN